MNRIIGFLDSKYLTRTVTLAVIVILLLTLWTASQQRALYACQVHYAEAVAVSQAPRVEAAQEDRKAVDDMVRAVIMARVGGDVSKALNTYVATREAADAKRAAHPLPEPPSKFCR